MFYPENFPFQKEKELIYFLKKLEKISQEEKIIKSKGYISLGKIFSKIIKENNTLSFKSIPPFWWLNFILFRHQKIFSPSFLNFLNRVLIKTKTRSLSGIIPVAVFTKPVGCPFHCIYCPENKNLPKSYLKDEPALRRALKYNFDPYLQTRNRLIALALSGHKTDKVEIIIKGGTFSFYSKTYRQNFIKEIFDAANSNIIQLLKTGREKYSKSKTLFQAQKINEKASSRIIGINVETRPDFITPQEIKFLRKLGVTHVELGIQTLNGQILKHLNRNQTLEQVIKATLLLKEAGFKVSYHLMPNLPFSSPQKDLQTFKKSFTANYSPDHLKIYPTTVLKNTTLFQWFKKKIYQPYSLKELINLLIKVKTEIIPPWVRISRLARDISEKEIIAPKIPSNLREIIGKKIKSLGKTCQCIRCREIRSQSLKGNPKLRIIKYQASAGKEYFLEFIDKENRCLGFLRLRIPAHILSPSKYQPPFSVLKNSAIIRELHIYGPALSLTEKTPTAIQHKNLGKKLIAKAENIAQNLKIKKLAVIAGIGVRDYYRKLGYRLKETYMSKSLN